MKPHSPELYLHTLHVEGVTDTPRVQLQPALQLALALNSFVFHLPPPTQYTHTNFCFPGRLVPCLTLKSAIKILPDARMTASLPLGIKQRILPLQASCWRTNPCTKQGIQVLKLCCPWKNCLHGSSENHHKKPQVQWWGWMKLECAKGTRWVLAWPAIGNQKKSFLSLGYLFSSTEVALWIWSSFPIQFPVCTVETSVPGGWVTTGCFAHNLIVLKQLRICSTEDAEDNASEKCLNSLSNHLPGEKTASFLTNSSMGTHQWVLKPTENRHSQSYSAAFYCVISSASAIPSRDTISKLKLL